MKQLAETYADALLTLAQSPEEAAGFEDALSALAALYEGSAELRDFLRSPVAPRAAQKDALAKLAPGAPPPVLNCLYLMADKGRLGELARMAAAFRKRRAALSGTLIISVRSPAPLSDAEAERLKRVFVQRFGAAGAVIDATVDPSLIGGAKVQIGDILFDESLYGRLKGLGRAISGVYRH